MIDVSGKWALITGASRGIGYEIAGFMAQKGCNLVLHSRLLEHTDKIRQEAESFGVEVYAVEAELSDMSSVGKMLDDIESRGIHIDIVFNDAGVQVAYRENYWATPAEDFTTSFLINTIAPAVICYRLIPKMIAKGFGRVINTTSGIRDQPEQGAYSSSKAALDKYTTDLGSVLEGTDVMINITDPGWCRTDLGGSQAPNSAESSMPGMVVGAFLDDKKSGRLLPAQLFTGMSLEDAVQKAYSM